MAGMDRSRGWMQKLTSAVEAESSRQVQNLDLQIKSEILEMLGS